MTSMKIFIIVFAILLHAFVEAEAQYGMLDFSPRFMFGYGSIEKRQSDGSACMVGYHSCTEVLNSTSDCCPNDSYCYLAPGGSAGNASCCAIGSNCENQCTSSEIAVPQTITINGNATSTFSCSARSCLAASAFQCPEDLGGGCCSYGSTCGPSSACVSTTDTATIIPVSSTAIGCGTSQFSCPAAEGGGCCSDGSKCTAADSTLLCVATITSGSITPTAIRSGPTGITDANFTDTSPSSGLSSGAKAGIGVGVALAVILFTIGILWFAVSRRIAARERHLAQSASGGMSEGSIGEKRFSPRTKDGADYFGSTAKTGPFTEVTGSGFTPLESPETANRGVPSSPQGPGDIAAPVEIGPSESVVPNRPYESDVPEKPEFRIEMP